jgi:hypothetical protein
MDNVLFNDSNFHKNHNALIPIACNYFVTLYKAAQQHDWNNCRF